MTLTEKLQKHPFEPWTLALYGQTHTGKSTQAAKLARHISKTSGLKTRWYLFDDGDTPAEVDAGIKDGFIELIDCRGVPHPFWGSLQVARGKVPILTGKVDEIKDLAEGSWQAKSLEGIGLVVVDSGTGVADDMFQDLSAKAALDINIGGEGAMNFVDGSAGWGSMKVGSSNRSHYNVVQTRMQDMIGRLKQLAAREGVMVLMTFTEDRGEQDSTKVTLIGPKTKGGAQTAVLPGWFKFCYRMVSVPQAANREPKHVLWTERHRDGAVDALANRRFPLLTEMQAKEFLPMIDPADVVRALLDYQKAVKMVAESGRA